jgi:hypothetical protein
MQIKQLTIGEEGSYVTLTLLRSGAKVQVCAPSSL